MPLYDRPDLQGFLDRLNRRSILTDEERDAILGLPTHVEQVRSNRDFVRLGETTDHASLIAAGMVGRFEQTREGARQITAIHIPGDMADLHSVVQPTSTSALQALSVSTILKIPHSAIRTAAAQYPAIAEALWRDCMVDSTILSEWVVSIGRRNARMRIGHLFCELATRLELAPSDEDIVFMFPITQLQLADATGLTPVHVNRTLMGLRQDGLMTVRGQRVWIHDWEGLASAADFDADYLQMDIAPEQRLRIMEVCSPVQRIAAN